MFSNKQIDVANLPKLEDLDMKPIDPKYLYVLFFNILVVYGVFILSLLFVGKFTGNDRFMEFSFYVIGGLLIFMLLSMLIYYLGFKKRAYAMREKDICYTHGYIISKTIALPYNRVQHIEISRSYIARKLGLSTLKIYSAGESGSDLVIHGLPEKIAESQYAFLTQVINERL